MQHVAVNVIDEYIRESHDSRMDHLLQVLSKVSLLHFVKHPLFFCESQTRPDSLDDIASPTLEVGPAIDTSLVSEILDAFMRGYSKYLRGIGLVDLESGEAEGLFYHVKQGLSVPGRAMYFHKRVTGGVLLVQVGIHAMDVCVNLFTIQDFDSDDVAFSAACKQVKDVLHLFSCMYSQTFSLLRFPYQILFKTRPIENHRESCY